MSDASPHIANIGRQVEVLSNLKSIFSPGVISCHRSVLSVANFILSCFFLFLF